jgi:hypothetical protein
MYLEISNIASALGKNPYESRQKMLLNSWARHAPKKVFEYLVQNKCIVKLAEEEETFSKMQEETYAELLPIDFDNKDFSSIEQKVVEEYKKKRNNEQTEEEIKRLKKITQNSLKKDLGNVQENNIIQKENYTRGNNKMYYYNITEDFCIGGKHDASSDSNDLLIEIKTRTRKQNVRRNEYDLYQLVGYLLATNFTQGKIVQIYNKEKFDSNVATEKEFGIISIEYEDSPWKPIADEIITGLKLYSDDLRELIKTGNYIYLDSVIPKKVRPIAKYDLFNNDNEEEIVLCEENVQYKNLLRFI